MLLAGGGGGGCGLGGSNPIAKNCEKKLREIVGKLRESCRKIAIQYATLLNPQPAKILDWWIRFFLSVIQKVHRQHNYITFPQLVLLIFAMNLLPMAAQHEGGGGAVFFF